ncbi:hypothetical protein BJP36_44095 [Moorena producens JHB]|uniref:Uncharacterized protein n=1 Tax=Moorena producens (strain JHB) TaxID=1454205 RepID=A0A9Q9STF5_MOOP1|nr:hypothetical protein [Moorena producens]WAN69344.1 hypothetical protein BJP36_44095 [Moorena producens JHB]
MVVLGSLKHFIICSHLKCRYYSATPDSRLPSADSLLPSAESGKTFVLFNNDLSIFDDI